MRVSQEIVLRWVKTRAIVKRKPYKNVITFRIDEIFEGKSILNVTSKRNCYKTLGT